MTLRLVHPAPPAQPCPPKGLRSPALFLTIEEHRFACAAMRNLKRQFGAWKILATAMGVRANSIHKAMQTGRGSSILFFRAAQIGGISFNAMITGRCTLAGTCPTCGAAAQVR